MSAFVVTSKTINAIVAFCQKRNFNTEDCLPDDLQQAVMENRMGRWNALGIAIHRMNAAAVASLYDEKPEPDDVYNYNQVVPPQPVSAVKALGLLLYQCIEETIPTWPLFKQLNCLYQTCCIEILEGLPQY